MLLKIFNHEEHEGSEENRFGGLLPLRGNPINVPLSLEKCFGFIRPFHASSGAKWPFLPDKT